MSKRTDVHRPSAIRTEDYHCIGYMYLAPSSADPFVMMATAEERRRIRETIERNGWKYSSHDHGGSCGVCGAWANYVGVFLHEPTQSIIYIGHECAAHVEMGDDGAFNALKHRVAAARERYRGMMRARSFTAEHGLPCMECASFSHDVLADMWSRLCKWGSLSDKQISYASHLIEGLKHPKAREESEPTPTKPAPNGRQMVQGVILGFKRVDSPYGVTLKMLVRIDDGGWKLWVTCPRMLKANKGDHIEINVTVKPSDRDQYFAFGSRPTKGRVLGSSAA